MSTEIQKTAQTALTITDDQTGFTEDQQEALLNHAGVSRNAKPADVDVFFHQVKRTGLDPFVKQIYMLERQGKQTIQTGIDGFRLIARRAVDRSGESLGYEDRLWCDQNGNWHDVPAPGQIPLAAKVTVLRNGHRFPAIALYDEYVARKRDGNVNAMWAQRPAGQLAKCAEALALRMAFPQDLSGLYTADEMQQADNEAPTPAPAPQVTQARSAASPAQPAAPKEDPVEKSLRDAWNDVGRLQKAVKFLSREGHPLLETARNRLEELTATAPAEGDDVEDAEIVEDEKETTNA